MSSLREQGELLRQIIMDHYQYPRNHGLVNDEHYETKHMASASCIDDIEVQVRLEEGIVKDVRFDGVACTISTASTSIMGELAIGKNKKEITYLMDQYFAMIDGKEVDEEVLQEAIAFCNVGKQANRIKCATIGWRALAALMGITEYADE